MAYFHHGTIRKYTAALLSSFNDIEVQYTTSTGQTMSKTIPMTYSSKEKSVILDKYTTEQLLSGNYNVLPRSSLVLSGLSKNEARSTNKNIRVNQYKTTDSIDYQFNSVSYDFNFEIVFQCRGMNEVSQIIEQIAPKFNPTVNIDVWDASNLNEPTRVPVSLLSIDIENEEYDEITSNIFNIVFSLTLNGNLYPPIQSQERIHEFKIKLNEIDGDYYATKEIQNWDVVDSIVQPPETLDTSLDGQSLASGSITIEE